MSFLYAISPTVVVFYSSKHMRHHLRHSLHFRIIPVLPIGVSLHEDYIRGRSDRQVNFTCLLHFYVQTVAYSKLWFGEDHLDRRPSQIWRGAKITDIFKILVWQMAARELEAAASPPFRDWEASFCEQSERKNVLTARRRLFR